MSSYAQVLALLHHVKKLPQKEQSQLNINSLLRFVRPNTSGTRTPHDFVFGYNRSIATIYTHFKTCATTFLNIKYNVHANRICLIVWRVFKENRALQQAHW